jgi:hypothetical protein
VKWLAIAMLAVLLASTAVQYNDPDPLRWMLAYLFVAGLTLAELLGRRPAWLLGLAFAGYLIAALYWSPALAQARWTDFGTLAMRSALHEEVREASGLWLCALWTGALLWRSRKPRRRRGAQRGEAQRR